jgi:hypothetical protein
MDRFPWSASNASLRPSANPASAKAQVARVCLRYRVERPHIGAPSRARAQSYNILGRGALCFIAKKQAGDVCWGQQRLTSR